MESAKGGKKKPRGKPFEKGHTGGPGRGHKKPAEGFGSNTHEDMRRAYEEAAKPDDPPGVKAARKLLKDDYAKFMTLFTRTNPGEPGQPAEAAEVAAAAGPQEENAVAMMERLLREWDAEEGGGRESTTSHAGARDGDEAQNGQGNALLRSGDEPRQAAGGLVPQG